MFAILLLGSLIIFGSELVTAMALVATFCAVVSQFIGQDKAAWRWHLVFSYVGMVIALVAIIAFAFGW